MGEVVKLRNSVMSADEVLASEMGKFDKVLVVGITHDGQMITHAGGLFTNHELVYLCEVVKQDVMADGWAMVEE